MLAFAELQWLLCHTRLSYHQRIVDIVPATFSALIPAEPMFVYKYMDESACKQPKPTQQYRCQSNQFLVVRILCKMSLHFLSPSASLPGYPVSVTVQNAIKNKASNEEILSILKEVPNPNQEDDDGQWLLSPSPFLSFPFHVISWFCHFLFVPFQMRARASTL